MNSFSKRGQVGDMVEMIPRIVILSVIAVVVFGIAASFYHYDISVRDVEARLLGRVVVDCLSEGGVVDLDKISEENYDEVLSYCGVSGGERVYVEANVIDSSGKSVARLYEGDSGLIWVRDLFELTGNVVNGFSTKSTEKIEKYSPGYYAFEYPVFVIEGGREFEGKVNVEVLVNYEDE